MTARLLRNPIAFLLDILFPPRCAVCDKIAPEPNTRICPACRVKLTSLTPQDPHTTGSYFEDCVSAYTYDGEIRDAVLRIKFRGAADAIAAFGEPVADCIRAGLTGRFDVLTYVPLSAKRKRTRGYNQSKLLADAVAKHLGIPVTDTLRKTRDTPAQSSLDDARERSANVADAYSVISKELISGRDILLIDDVVTTGSTLSECARELLLAGCNSVVCASLAKTQHDGNLIKVEDEAAAAY